MLFTRCQATRDAVAQAARAPHGLAPALLAHVFPPTAHTCLAPRSCPCVPRAGDASRGRPGEKRQGDSAEAMWQHAHWSRGAAHLRLQHTGFNAHTCRTAVAAAAAVLPYVPKAPRPSYSTLTRPCLRCRGSRPSGARRLSPRPSSSPFALSHPPHRFSLYLSRSSYYVTLVTITIVLFTISLSGGLRGQ